MLIQSEAQRLRLKADALSERLRRASITGNMDTAYREVCDALSDALRLRDDILLVAHNYQETH